MEFTYHELKAKTLAELKEIAATIEDEAVKGYTQMNKEHLLKQLCAALHIDMHEHHEVHGLDKSGVKARIRALKKERDAVLGKRDPKQLKAIRLKMSRLKHTLRKAAE